MAKAKNNRPLPGRLQFEKEVLSHAQVLKGFARKLTGNPSDADDLIQDTFLKALSNQDRFEPGTGMRAWLCTIMRNTFYTSKRRSWRNVPYDPELAEKMLIDPGNIEHQEEILEELDAVVEVLAALNPDQRDVIIGARYLGLPYDQMAVILGCELGTIKSRVNRADAEIQRLLETGMEFSYDLEPWATATKKVPKDHPYFPIAKAYEEIYAYLRKSPTQKVVEKIIPPKKKDDLEDLWKELQESGALDIEEELDRAIRR